MILLLKSPTFLTVLPLPSLSTLTRVGTIIIEASPVIEAWVDC